MVIQLVMMMIGVITQGGMLLTVMIMILLQVSV